MDHDVILQTTLVIQADNWKHSL